MNRCRLGKKLLLLASAVCLSWLVPTAAADSNARIVRLSYVSGDVQVDRRQGQGFEQAIMNMPIAQGTRVWTRGSEALAEIEFEDGSAIRLTPDANVEFQELSLRGSGEKVTALELQGGTAYLDIRDHMGDFRLTTGGQQITVEKAARFRVLADKSQFKVAVYKGNVSVLSAGNTAVVRKDETFTFDSSNPDHYNLAKSISEGSYDDWNQERQRYSESFTNTAAASSASTYYDNFSPAYSYGLSDLGYYGNFFYAPAWGWMWRPYYMGANWNPFMDGAWAWYPQFGYMWVSSYPWGWMPYRYGAWNFVPGYGWCWMPGTVWNTWVPVTAVNRPPVHWVPVRAPAAPPQPGGTGIVAVGRGWKTVYPPGGAMPALNTSSGTHWGTSTGAKPITIVGTPPKAGAPTTSAPKTNTAPPPRSTSPSRPSGSVPHSTGSSRSEFRSSGAHEGGVSAGRSSGGTGGGHASGGGGHR